MSNISLKQLEVFVAIVEHGNFSEAGRHLYLAQSTVSSHIKTLEDTLHVMLFQRESKKNLILTAEGKRVYQYASEVIRKCNALESALGADRQHELMIGASSVPSKILLPRIMVSFSRQHPDCSCIIKSGSSEQIQQMVLDGDCQLGFVGSTDNRQALCYDCVAPDHLVLITANTPRFHSLFSQGVPGKTLLTEPLIFRNHGSGTQKMVDNYFCSLEGAKSQAKYYVSDPDLLQELVAQGLGVSVVSARSVEERVRSGRLIPFPLEDTPLKRNIYAVYRKKSALSEPAKDFLRLARDIEAGAE